MVYRAAAERLESKGGGARLATTSHDDGGAEPWRTDDPPTEPPRPRHDPARRDPTDDPSDLLGVALVLLFALACAALAANELGAGSVGALWP